MTGKKRQNIGRTVEQRSEGKELILYFSFWTEKVAQH
jgi:hypothetical protein